MAFGRSAANLKFESYTGGRDSKERLTQVIVVEYCPIPEGGTAKRGSPR